MHSGQKDCLDQSPGINTLTADNWRKLNEGTIYPFVGRMIKRNQQGLVECPGTSNNFTTSRPKGARGASRWRDPGALNTTWSKCTCELETAVLYCNENKILALEATEIGGLFMATTTIPNGYIYKSFTVYIPIVLGFPGGSDGKEFACNTGDMGPRSG